MEEMVLDGGKVINPSLADYLIPSSLDMPEITPIILEMSHKDGPYGAKGFADAAPCPVEAAIANAIYNATGIRIKEGPITPEKILKAMKGKAA